jgi:hypothetical protein
MLGHYSSVWLLYSAAVRVLKEFRLPDRCGHWLWRLSCLHEAVLVLCHTFVDPSLSDGSGVRFGEALNVRR